MNFRIIRKISMRYSPNFMQRYRFTIYKHCDIRGTILKIFCSRGNHNMHCACCGRICNYRVQGSAVINVITSASITVKNNSHSTGAFWRSVFSSFAKTNCGSTCSGCYVKFYLKIAGFCKTHVR